MVSCTVLTITNPQPTVNSYTWALGPPSAGVCTAIPGTDCTVDPSEITSHTAAVNANITIQLAGTYRFTIKYKIDSGSEVTKTVDITMSCASYPCTADSCIDDDILGLGVNFQPGHTYTLNSVTVVKI